MGLQNTVPGTFLFISLSAFRLVIIIDEPYFLIKNRSKKPFPKQLAKNYPFILNLKVSNNNSNQKSK